MPTIDWSNPAFKKATTAAKSGGTAQIDWSNPAFTKQKVGQTPPTPQPTGNRFLKGLGTYAGRVGSDVTGAVTQANTDISANADVQASKSNPFKKLGSEVMAGLNVAGDVAGAVTVPISEAVAPVVDSALTDKAKKGLGGIVKSAQDNFPTASRVVGDVANIAALPLGGEGSGVVKGAVESVADKATGVLTKDATKTSEKTLSNIADTVSPKLNAKQTAEALASRGAKKSRILGKITLNRDPYDWKIASTVKELVPEFNPKATLAENINATKSALSREAESLKSKVDAVAGNRIFPLQELGSRLASVEKPLLIASDSTLNNAYDRVVSKAMEIAQNNGGKISSLFDTRKELDDFIGQQFPNMYSSDTLTPMRSAVKGIRNEINSFIEDNLPKGTGFKASLTKQSHLFDAIDNMAERAASGPEKEVDTNVIQRTTDFVKKHPIVTGLGAYEAADTVKKALHL